MPPVSVSAAVDAPRERVFDYISDLSNRAAWTDHFVRDFRLERIEPSGQGAAAHFRVDAPRGIRFMDSTIVEAERPHRIVEQGRGGKSNRIAIRTAWELTEGPGAVTTVTLTFLTDPAGRRGGRWWRRRWRKALRRLGTAIESGAPAQASAGVAGGNRQLTGIA
jgi:uncharacterized protein YndB with AHSA1/START domain